MTWNAVGNIKGPQGDEGPPGTTSFDDLEDVPDIVYSDGTLEGAVVLSQSAYNALGSGRPSTTMYVIVG